MGGEGRPENRQLEVSEISRKLKLLAREFNVPVLALSQLSRGLETRQDKHPLLSDLRESGALEQDADVVMFLYRDEEYDPDPNKKGLAEVNIAKHRAGPIGRAQLAWLAAYTRFENMASDSVADSARRN
jgi:replicative DNA helicase